MRHHIQTFEFNKRDTGGAAAAPQARVTKPTKRLKAMHFREMRKRRKTPSDSRPEASHSRHPDLPAGAAGSLETTACRT